MGLMGIVAYRPKQGAERKFLSLIKKHAPLLKSLEGISEASFLMKSVDEAYMRFSNGSPWQQRKKRCNLKTFGTC
jgi:hypothetical protein